VDQLDALLLRAVRDRLGRLDLRDFAMEQRYLKTGAELALVRAAARHADTFLAHLLAHGGDIIAQGGTEQDLLSEGLRHATDVLKRERRDDFAGTPLRIAGTVHSGPRAALPHGAVQERRPEPGDTVIAGIGACLGGYHAESGATFIVGEPSPEQRRAFAAMRQANDAAMDALRPGVRCDAVNEAALGAIREAGFGDAIRHRIGHGMGLDGHEAPWLAPGDRTLAAPGMVFSNEPGIYRPGATATAPSTP
jgi:Xaa-Pro aminopeptidase